MTDPNAMTQQWNAYHFTGDRLRDGTPLPAIGEKLTYDGDVKICQSGLHASRTALHALDYASGPLLHRVFCDGIVTERTDKFVCRERTIIASIDATDILREFARTCALDVAYLWDMPEIVRRYLETGDERIRYDARDAARVAAARVAAARDAAMDAARAAQSVRLADMIDHAFEAAA